MSAISAREAYLMAYYKGMIDALNHLEKTEISEVARKYIDLRDDVYREQDDAVEKARIDGF